MKKQILTLVAILTTICSVNAQQKYYAEITGMEDRSSNNTIVRVTVDFGKQKARFASLMLDENGKRLHFTSMVDAMNHFASLGWKLESTSFFVDGDCDYIDSEYHWVISKEEPLEKTKQTEEPLNVSN